MRLLTMLPALILAGSITAQNVGINATGAAPAAPAMLDVDATNRGVLVPRVALAAANLNTPIGGTIVNSLLVYNTATAGAGANVVTPGYYYWDASIPRWVRFAQEGDAWRTLGNAGTVAGTNFIGTTDAQDFVVKTGGAAAANERMRVLAGGKVVVNNVGVGGNTNDVFSVYANNTTNGTNTNTSAQGLRAVVGYTSTGFGTSGFASGTSGLSFGLYGEASAATGTANAIRGEAVAPNAIGLVAFGNAGGGAIPTATTGHGVYGQVDGTLAGTAVGIGVRGVIAATMTTGDARGVQGSSPANNGVGVIGFATTAAATANPVGSYGQAASATGFGMRAVNTNVNGTGQLVTGNNALSTYLINGSGLAVNGSNIATFSFGRNAANGIGVVAVGNNLAASIFAPAQGCGIAATGTRYGVHGYATATVNTNPLNNSAANGLAGAAGGYFEVQNVGTAQTWAYVAVREVAGAAGLRKIIGPGTVNTIVEDTEGELVALACPEAPENLFMDYGSGRLLNGRARIELDPILAKNIVVDEAHPLRVFIQLEGDCNGVYVTNKHANGFEVVELMGGHSHVTFTWNVVANRADEVNPDGSLSRYSAERFPPAPGPVHKTLLATGEADGLRAVGDMHPQPVVRP